MITATIPNVIISVFIVSIIFVGWANDRKVNSKIEANASQIAEIKEDQMKSSEVLAGLMNTVLANITASNLNQNAQSNGATLTKFNMNFIITDALITKGAMNKEELKNMAFVLGINGKSGIDYSTQSSTARGIITAMDHRGKVVEMAEYIRTNRPDIFEGYQF